jgi:hypothetical protein
VLSVLRTLVGEVPAGYEVYEYLLAGVLALYMVSLVGNLFSKVRDSFNTFVRGRMR